MHTPQVPLRRLTPPSSSIPSIFVLFKMFFFVISVVV
jgi:hypothetical protein